MLSKFSYKPIFKDHKNIRYDHYLNKGIQIYNKQKEEVTKCLDKFIDNDGVIDGTILMDNWFRISHKDIFISHSHDDLNDVKAFAGWLQETFGLSVFIDSISWNYCDDLLRKLDDKYCYDEKTHTYNYRLRNYTTSHVHMMLASSLTKMMNETECVIFFNTPNSINVKSEIENISQNKTRSPWIYHELLMSSMLKVNEPKRLERYSTIFEQRKVDIDYNVKKYLEKMVDLSDEDLKNWKIKWNENKSSNNQKIIFPLDILYILKHDKKTGR